MKVLLICVGSRGDTEPFCSLAAELIKNNNHSVEFFIQPELKELAPKKSEACNNNINIHVLPFTQYDFYKYANNPTKELDNPNPRVKFVGIITDLMIGLILPCWNNVLNVASMTSKCDVIVTSALARSLSFAIGSKLQIPTCLIHLQPLIPTDLFPHYSSRDNACVSSIMGTTADNVDPIKNLDSYWSLEEWQHEFLKDDLEKLYKINLELPSTIDYDKNQIILSGQHPSVWLANCFYVDTLIPNIIDIDDIDIDDDNKKKKLNILNIGPLADSYIPKDFVEPSDDDSDLVKFLKSKNPICVGFGSMPFGQVQDIIDVLRDLNEDAIFVGKALELSTTTTDNDNEDEDDNEEKWKIQHHIRQVTSLPYGWLLPKCKMMLCHGGAGVVHSTLRAGIPCVIAPLFGDQPFWSELVSAKNIGVRVGTNLTTITKEEWKIAIMKACNDEIVNKAREFGTNIQSQQESGVERMVRALEEKIVVC